ncbi:MAG: hypothetical protein DRN40_06735 [Thermoplasmata archaeon]|nr:MAG: hypothetical protein DRN40_06735 [Thermoplasmata archaeon]
MPDVKLQEVLETPEIVLDLSSSEVVNLLLSMKSGWGSSFYEEIGEVPYIMVLGDLHGDFSSLRKPLRRFIEDEDVHLVALGDYTDRSAVPGGSVVTAMVMLALKRTYPQRVVLLQGNHENYYLFPFVPYDLPGEVEEVWGREKEAQGILYVLSSILADLPVIAVARCGVVFTHGGILKDNIPLKRGDSHRDVEGCVGHERYREAMYGLLWGGPKGYARHVVAPGANYSEEELKSFLKRFNSVIHIRGHDPYLNGRFLFSQRDVTITSFGEWGLYCLFEGDRMIEKETVRSRIRLYSTSERG